MKAFYSRGCRWAMKVSYSNNLILAGVGEALCGETKLRTLCSAHVLCLGAGVADLASVSSQCQGRRVCSCDLAEVRRMGGIQLCSGCPPACSLGSLPAALVLISF